MPPPATPSPHRFLIKKRGQNPGTPVPSGLSHQVFGESSTAQPNPGPTPSQFVRAPRSTASVGRRASFPPRSPSPTRSEFTATVPAQMEQVQEDEDEEMLDNGNLDFTQFVSEDSLPEPEKVPVYLPRSPKRQRVDGGEATLTSKPTPGRFVLPPSTSTGRTLFNTDGTTPSRPAFVLPPSTNIGRTVFNTEGATPSRPAFLMSSVQTQEPAEPLPDAFSPRRKGQKFVLGGLAAEVQSWVIEAGQSVKHNRRGKGHYGGQSEVDPVDTTIRVTEVKGREPVFVRGQMADRGQAKAMLVDGQQASQKAETVGAGDVVSIRLPSWEVQVSGEVWVVGVDWRTTKK